MARGFGSVRGVGDTDMVKSTLTVRAAQRSYSILAKRNGNGFATLGRVVAKHGVTAAERLYHGTGTGAYYYRHNFSTTNGEWTMPDVATGVWHQLGVGYDNGSTSNVPTLVLNGASQSITTITSPAGTATTNSEAITLGNNDTSIASQNDWDGDLAEFGAWDALLTADEWKALGAGVSPLLIRPTALVEYIALNDTTVRSYVRGTPTLSGTAFQQHPQVFRPQRQPIIVVVSGAVTFSAAIAEAAAAADAQVILQILRPLSDAVAGGWTTSTGSGTLASMVDEVTPSDVDYIQSSAGPSNDAVRMKLDPGAVPVATGVGFSVLSYRIGSIGAASSAVVKLWQGNGTTLVASWSHGTVPGSFTRFDQALSSSQMALITDPTDVYIEVVAS